LMIVCIVYPIREEEETKRRNNPCLLFVCFLSLLSHYDIMANNVLECLFDEVDENTSRNQPTIPVLYWPKYVSFLNVSHDVQSKNDQ